MLLASETHWTRGLDPCQHSLLFHCESSVIHSNSGFLGKRLTGPPWVRESLWSNRHAQKRQGHIAPSGHQSLMDMKNVFQERRAQKTGISPPWHRGSVPSKGNGETNKWRSVCYRMANINCLATKSKIKARTAWDLIQTKNYLPLYDCFPAEDDKEGREAKNVD